MKTAYLVVSSALAILSLTAQAQVQIDVHRWLPEDEVEIVDGKKMHQRLDIFLDGSFYKSMWTSTGISVPVIDGLGFPSQTTTREGTHPVTEIEEYRESKQYEQAPMPHAVRFHAAGQFIHETPAENYGKLGSPASHGCVRLTKDDAFEVYGLVEKYGVENSTVTVVEGEDVPITAERLESNFSAVNSELRTKYCSALSAREMAIDNGDEYIPAELPPSGERQMVIYTRIYNRDATTGVFLPDNFDYSCDSMYGNGPMKKKKKRRGILESIFGSRESAEEKCKRTNYEGRRCAKYRRN